MRLRNKIFSSQEEKGSAQREKILAYKRLFATADGKEVLCDLINRFHILASHGGEPMKEGQRSVVLEIMKNCNVDMVQFDKMLKGEF